MNEVELDRTSAEADVSTEPQLGAEELPPCSENSEIAPEEQQADTPAQAANSESPEDVIVAEVISDAAPAEDAAASLKAVVEAAIYITDEPLTAEQIASATEQPLDRIKEILSQLVSEYAAPDRGLTVRELAGGYKMGTKPEHHESIRRFVKKLQAPLKLSLAALETLAVIAYKQPITAPEIMEIRGVQGAGVLKTLLDRKLIAAAGRKNVLGKPIMYKTTREFLIQFGLSTLAELPTLKEFEELGRLAMSDTEENASTPVPSGEAAPNEHAAAPLELVEREPADPVDSERLTEPEPTAENQEPDA
jgi:segregation and condensation protein B